LCEALLNENEVIAVDDLSTGSLTNISHFIEKGKVSFLEGTVTDLGFMKKMLRGADYVFHQAAITSVPRSVKDPLKTNEANVSGTLTTLIAARDAGVKKFIFASSSSVYGDTPTLPKKEEMAPNPLSPYALTKDTCESYCRLFEQLYGLKTMVLRYFNVFGPRQDPNSEYAAVIPKFINCALSGDRLTICGDGEQTRDFTFVKDVVNANMLAACSEAVGIYNIASGRRTTINELAQIISQLTGSRSETEHCPPRPGEVRHSLADISKAREAFGYAPRFTLLQGLEETVKWFKGSKD
jgi:UDP-glucose 4-epimerase